MGIALPAGPDQQGRGWQWGLDSGLPAGCPLLLLAEGSLLPVPGSMMPPGLLEADHFQAQHEILLFGLAFFFLTQEKL